MQPTAPNTLPSLLARVLDQGYTSAVEPILRAILRSMERGAVGRRLADLEAEAARIAEQSERLEHDSAEVRALIADVEDAARAASSLIDSNASELQALGIAAAAALTVRLSTGVDTPAQLASVGITWNTPSADAIAAAVRYADSAAFAASLQQFQDGIVTTVRNIAVNGFADGWGALRIARELRNTVTTLPGAYANQLMRSLQLTSYRDATAVHQLANADILEPYAIRIAALDARTCLSCIALHGTRIPLGERVHDHRNGRCTSIAPLRGRTINVTTGEAWFDSLPEARQREQMGSANYAAWQAGAVQLQDFVHRGTDPLFGEVVTQASLKRLLGRGAQQFYARS